ncbi:MAG: hypothetical protein GY946_03350 [bacterium]|nr:hypothetical protein [bacterium]
MQSHTEEVALVGEILQGYAERGVFRGYSRQAATPARANFRLWWHRDQVFDLRYEPRTRTLRFACVLPSLPAGSAMYRDFRAWLKARKHEGLPAHRRCDPKRVELKPYNRGGNVALTLRSVDGDIDHAVRTLVGVVHEIYLDFLSNGLYFDWLIETFELDPDNPY